MRQCLKFSKKKGVSPHNFSQWLSTDTRSPSEGKPHHSSWKLDKIKSSQQFPPHFLPIFSCLNVYSQASEEAYIGLEVWSQVCCGCGPLCPPTEEEQGHWRNGPIYSQYQGHWALLHSLRCPLQVCSTLAVTNVHGPTLFESVYTPHTSLSIKQGQGDRGTFLEREMAALIQGQEVASLTW